MNSRRQFLQKMTAVTPAFFVMKHAMAAVRFNNYDTPYDGPMLRVAIMGLGSYGTRVAEAMQILHKSKAGWRYQRNAIENNGLAAEI